MGEIKRQGIINIIISYLGIIIGFVNILILQPLMLKPEELGLTRIIYSSTILFATIFPFGLNFLTLKYFPAFKNRENGHNGYFGFLTLFSCISFLLVCVIVMGLKGAILSKYQNSPLFIEYFNYIFPIAWFQGMIVLYTGYANSLFKTSVPSFLNEVYLRLFTTVIVSIYFLQLISFEWFMRLYLFSFASQLLLLIIYLTRIGNISLKINWPHFKNLNRKEILKYTILLALASFSSIALRNVDIMFIGSYINLDAVAIYTIAFTIGSIIEAPANALGKIADSKISDAYARGDSALIKTVYFKSTKYLMIVGSILLVGICINVHDLINLLPKKYAEGEIIIVIISLSSFFNMATGINSSMIYFSNKYVAGTYLLFGMVALTILLNLVLIVPYGIVGAAIATGSSLFLYNVFKFMLIWKSFNLQPYGSYVLKLVFLIIFCLGLNYILPNIEKPLTDMLYRSSIATAVYFIGVFLLKITPEFHHYVPVIGKKYK